jgi:DNA-binding transcriptional regulator GbsR (MarR family)
VVKVNENYKKDIYKEEKEYLEIVNNLVRSEIEKTSERHRDISKEKLSWEDRQRGEHFKNCVRDLEK